MPKQHNIDSDGKDEVTSRDLAERFVAFAAEQGVELRGGEIYGANLEDLMRPGEVLRSNRRAFFEPDPIVDAIVREELAELERDVRALPADMDPSLRFQWIDRLIGKQLRYWASRLQAELQHANDLQKVQRLQEALAQVEARVLPGRQVSPPGALPDSPFIQLQQWEAFIQALAGASQQGSIQVSPAEQKSIQLMLEDIRQFRAALAQLRNWEQKLIMKKLTAQREGKGGADA